MKDQFKAAAKLINEWRDTLTYTALASFVVADYAITGRLDFHPPLILAATRELLRSRCWARPDMRLVGSMRKPINRVRFATHALASGVCLWGAEFSVLHFAVDAASMAGATAVLVGMNGGPKSFIESYKTMWDWPRKRDDNDGGTSQTAKLKQGFSNLARGLGRRLAPTARVMKTAQHIESAEALSLN